MLYHLNNAGNIDNDSLTASFQIDELGPLTHYSNPKAYVNDRKRLFETSFSEKYESVRQSKKSICEIIFPRKSTFIFLIYLLIFVLYLYLGALCFKLIELGKEKEDRMAFFQFRTKFLKNNPAVKEGDLEDLINYVQALTRRGINAVGNATVSRYNWEFSNSVFFATSLITTIGYGNDKPVTASGKIFCIIFVIIGIPMMMVMISAVVERLFLLVDLLFSAVFFKLQWTITEDRFREIQIIFCFIVFVICFLIIPAAAFYRLEESRWSFIDSVYFCVISLTTIGLGDLVPGNGPDLEKRNVSRILTTVYIFTGLLAASFCIRVFYHHKNWNFGDRFIYLNNEPHRMQEYTIESSSLHSENTEHPQSVPTESNLQKH